MWRNCAWSKHVNHFCFQNRDSNIAEEKRCCKVGSASAQRRTESSSQEGRRRTAAALWGRRWAVFEQNCCHRWNMDTRFWTTTEISVLSAEACNFSSPEKCRHQQLKVKPMMIVAYDKNGVIATDRVPTGSTVTVAHYRKFLQDVLHPKIRQKSLPCLQLVSSFCTIMRGLKPQVQYRKFWKSMDGKRFPICRTVLTWGHQTLTCSQNWRNHSMGKASEALRRHLMRWPE